LGCRLGKPGRLATVEVPDGLVHAIELRVDEINKAAEGLFDVLRSGEPIAIHSGLFRKYESIFNTPISSKLTLDEKMLKSD
jgi:hypothetical protein